jgi:DNA-nicking Smr family endonuclease
VSADDEEARLFEEAMRDVRRMEAEAEPPGEPLRAGAAPAVRHSADPPAFDIEIAGERVSIFHPSLPPPARRALRRGVTAPERTLDLHGSRAASAVREVERFLADARASGARCVLVITGRGLRSGPEGPVLRDQVVRILTQTALAGEVLGVTSAPTSLGSTGALLVLLRKSADRR